MFTTTTHPDGRTLTTYNFSSLAELADFSINRQSFFPSKSTPSSREEGKKASWDMGVDFPLSVSLCQNGWEQGAEKLLKRFTSLAATVSEQILKRPIKWDVIGQHFDVSRVVNGEPESWFRKGKPVRKHGSRRLVTILVNISASCAIRSSVIEARGMVIAALAAALARAGRSVKIVVSAYSEGNGCNDVQINTIVKQPEAPFDLARTAYALCHPAMLRRQYLAVMENCEHFITYNAVGYGVPTEIPHDPNVIYMGMAHAADSHWMDDYTAQEWIVEQLRQQGVEMKTNDANREDGYE